MTRAALALALLVATPVVCRGPSAFAAQGGPTPAAEPFKKAGQEPLEFRGPGRDEPEPDVSEVVIGWFGPDDPAHPELGDLWRGATMAIDLENAAGGYHGKPFRLVSSWSESPWKAGIVGVARLVHEQGAWAVIGGVDGTTTHLAVQLALKSHFLLLSPASTDVTTDLANVPWLFSLPPSDERIAPVLAEAVAQAAGGGPVVVAAATDHDSRAALVATRRALGARQLTPEALVAFAPLEDDPGAIARRVLEVRPRALLVLGPSRAAGRLVAALRGAGYSAAIVGGEPLGRNAFRRSAGAAADGVIVPRSVAAGPETAELGRAYRQRWGEPPDDAALRSYDAVRIVAAAIRRAGLNRARIRDAVRALAPWTGVAGVVRWDALGRCESSVASRAWTGARLTLADPVLPAGLPPEVGVPFGGGSRPRAAETRREESASQP